MKSASLPEPETVEARLTKTTYDATATRSVKPVAALRNDLLEERRKEPQDEAQAIEVDLDTGMKRLLSQALKLHDPGLLEAWSDVERERQGYTRPARHNAFLEAA